MDSNSTLNATTQKLAQQMVATRSNPQVIGFIPVNGLPYETNMQWNLPGTTSNLYPTARLDVHLTSKLNYSTTWNLYRWDIVGEPYYPGAPVPSWNTNNNAAYMSTRYIWTHTFDYTFTPHLLNTSLSAFSRTTNTTKNPPTRTCGITTVTTARLSPCRSSIRLERNADVQRPPGWA